LHEMMWKNLVETEVTHGIKIRGVFIAFWIPKVTDTTSEYVMHTVFHDSSGYAKAPHCYVTHILPVLLSRYMLLSAATKHGKAV
jgi:hypothetical protein